MIRQTIHLLKIGALAIVTTGILTSCTRPNTYIVQPASYNNTFNDDFNYDAHDWSFSSDAAAAEASVSGGVLNYSYYPTSNGTNTLAISTGWDPHHNWDIQTRVSSNNAVALAFGVSSTTYGYSIFIDSNRSFAVFDEGGPDQPPRPLISWQQNSAIRPGWNTLEIEQYNTFWTGYINGTQVFRIPSRPISGGQVGYQLPPSTTAHVDYLTIHW